MPAQSKSQQRLFGMVHAYQQGKLKNVSPKIKHIAKTIKPDEAEKYAKTPHKGLEELKRIYESPEYVELVLQEIIDTNTPASVKGHVIDKFTATMITTVLKNLNEENKTQLLSRPLNEMVAVAYKVLAW
jgi:hypothetical protein